MLLAERRQRRKKAREGKAQGCRERQEDGDRHEEGGGVKGRATGQEYLEFLPVGAQPKLGPPGVLAWGLAVRNGVNKTALIKRSGKGKIRKRDTK